MSDELRKAAEEAIKMINEVFDELDGDEWPDLFNAREGLSEALVKEAKQDSHAEPIAWTCSNCDADNYQCGCKPQS